MCYRKNYDPGSLILAGRKNFFSTSDMYIDWDNDDFRVRYLTMGPFHLNLNKTVVLLDSESKIKNICKDF